MQNILAFLARFGTHIVFIVLEIICFYLIVNYNSVQNSIFLNSTSLYSTKINSKFDQLDTYLKLESVNDSLLNENRQLLQQIIASTIVDNSNTSERSQDLDSLKNQYTLIPATICNKTINLRNNHISLCKGAVDGIKEKMGVISALGLVGIVKEVSEHYSHVVALQHSQSRISCSISGEYAFGNLIWKSKDVRKATLEGVPKHTQVSIGDTIITNGFSAIFPKGIGVGTVADFSVKRGSNNYNISVDLFNDLSTLEYVYVISNLFADEQEKLEDE